MNTPIHDFLMNYAASGTLRCHMPGAKGVSYPLDITEIDGADSLYESSGIIARSEEIAAKLFGAEKTLFSCSGSTLSIQTMLALARAASGKNRVSAARYAHKSLISTAVTLGMDVDWIYPDEYLSAAVSPQAVERSITADTAAVFINSIDYYGGMCDIKAVSAVCKAHGVPLLADNAHGAYLVFTDSHPIRNGAAMTADSAHKTLPCITGGAYLHIADGNLVPRSKEIMALYGTSSPSYLILDSLDLCNQHIAEEKQKAEAAFSAVEELKKRLSEKWVSLRKSDMLRVTVNAYEMGMSGFELADRLREKGVECEMCDRNNVIFLFSTITTKADAERLYNALTSIRSKKPVERFNVPVLTPAKAMPPREAFFRKVSATPVPQAVGKICGGIYAPCPPCVPLIMPGEIIDSTCAEVLLKYGCQYIETL